MNEKRGGDVYMSKKDFLEAKEAKKKLAEAEKAEAEAKKAEEAEKAKAKKAEEAEKDDGIEEKIIAFLEIVEAGMKDFERRLSELEVDKASKKDKKPEPAVAAPDRSTSTTYEKIHPPKGDAADFWDVLLPDGDYAVKKTKEAAEAEANASDPSGAPHVAIPFPWWVDAQGEPVERVKPEEAKAMRRMRI